MGIPIASHMYECSMAEVGERGALLADPRAYKEAMKMPDDKQWEKALRTEIKQLDGVCSAPCPLPYGAQKIKTRFILKKKRSRTEAKVH